jgi:hypothetical protein
VATEGDLDYALARVSSRHGERLDDGAWRRLEASRDLSHYVAAARSSALVRWVSSVENEHDCHTIERILRAQWRRYVDGVAAWHPHPWQRWLGWMAWLPGLSLLAQLARPEAVRKWLLADPLYGPISLGAPADRAQALAHTALAPLRPVVSSGAAPGPAWSAQWRLLQPRTDVGTEYFLQQLRRALEQHQQALLRATDESEPLRKELANHLQKLFRAAAGTVVVTVCHLALVALDLERLRGGLARRCLFGDSQAEHP